MLKSPKITKSIAMSVIKEEVHHLLDTLPDDCTLEDVHYHLYVLEKIKRGQADIEAGRVHTQEEVEAHFAQKWQA